MSDRALRFIIMYLCILLAVSALVSWRSVSTAEKWQSLYYERKLKMDRLLNTLAEADMRGDVVLPKWLAEQVIDMMPAE